jgi:putative transposase
MGSWRAGCVATRMSGSAVRAGETDRPRGRHRAPARPNHFKMHPGAPAEPVLAAWGIDTDGKPVFVGLGPAVSESTDAWNDFLADLTQRGLKPPLLGISDGAAGLTGAFDRAFPTSLRQRCLVHRARNTLAKVSAHDQAAVKADFWAVFDVGEAEPGDQAVAVAQRQAAEFAAKWQARYPAAVACVTDDLAALTVHLRFPWLLCQAAAA